MQTVLPEPRLVVLRIVRPTAGVVLSLKVTTTGPSKSCVSGLRDGMRATGLGLVLPNQ
ncbi:MAG: hypothetical protein HS116_07425 [Planctomycetes bacterium]|nr:hypothetical protein [Planctomycetota bacterium]